MEAVSTLKQDCQERCEVTQTGRHILDKDLVHRLNVAEHRKGSGSLSLACWLERGRPANKRVYTISAVYKVTVRYVGPDPRPDDDGQVVHEESIVWKYDPETKSIQSYPVIDRKEPEHGKK